MRYMSWYSIEDLWEVSTWSGPVDECPPGPPPPPGGGGGKMPSEAEKDVVADKIDEEVREVVEEVDGRERCRSLVH